MIIAQGLFSWVPPEVREKILEICETRLAPHGLAFISYLACIRGPMSGQCCET